MAQREFRGHFQGQRVFFGDFPCELDTLIGWIAGLYKTCLAIVGVCEIHTTTTGKAALVVLVPAAVILLLGLILVVLAGGALFFSTQRLSARARSGA